MTQHVLEPRIPHITNRNGIDWERACGREGNGRNMILLSACIFPYCRECTCSFHWELRWQRHAMGGCVSVDLGGIG